MLTQQFFIPLGEKKFCYKAEQAWAWESFFTETRKLAASSLIDPKVGRHGVLLIMQSDFDPVLKGLHIHALERAKGYIEERWGNCAVVGSLLLPKADRTGALLRAGAAAL